MPGFSDSEYFNELIRTWPTIAIKQLYERYYDSLVHIAERRTHDLKASEDIVQEVLIEVWKKSGSLASRKGFMIGPYLIRLVKNRAITFYLQNLRFSGSDTDITGLPDTQLSQETELIQSDKYKTLKNIVSTLPARQRECIELRFFEEMSVKSIALQLGISVKSVEKNITKALKRLRNYRSSIY